MKSNSGAKQKAVKQVVKKWVYPNGLTLIVDEAPQLMSVAIGAWVKTGTRHEDPDSAGLSHFLEHMVFKGGKKRGAQDISKAVDRVGGDFNAFTSREHTCFHFYLPAKELKLGSELLKEILFHPLFAPVEVDKERKVILQEIAMVKETPEEECFDLFMEKFFGKHPLGRQILGSKKSISEVTRKKLFDFFYQHYRPENMILSVSGAVSFSSVKKQFEFLGSTSWPHRKISLRKAPWGMDPPEKTEPGFHWFDANTEQAHVLYGIPAWVSTSRERVMSIMLQQYLGGGMSSVFFDQIREKKGWAYSVYANAVHFLDSSLFIVYAGVQNSRVIDTLQVFDRELRRIARQGIPQKELMRIQDSLIYSFRLSLENSEARMMTISTSELFYKQDIPFKNYEKIVRSIKVKDIQKLLSKWLSKGRPTVLVMARKPKRKMEMKKLQSFASTLCGKDVSLLKQV